MKALRYLATKGVPLRGNKDSLIATILFLCPYGNKELTIYPEAEWIGVENMQRCMIHWLDGTVEEIYAELKAMPITDLVVMLEHCMDVIVWDYGLEKRERNLPKAMKDGRQWATLWNGFLGLETAEDGAWAHKAEVIETYAVENRWKQEAKGIVEMLEGVVPC